MTPDEIKKGIARRSRRMKAKRNRGKRRGIPEVTITLRGGSKMVFFKRDGPKYEAFSPTPFHIGVMG